MDVTLPSDRAHDQSSAEQTPATPRAVLRVGTRGSALALWQTNWVLDRVRAEHPEVDLRVETIRTQGDRTQALETPLAHLGDKGMFIAELEHALLAGGMDAIVQPMNDHALAQAERQRAQPIDAAVHSLKDLPGALTAGLELAAITERADPRDVLISRSGQTLKDLPMGASVATSSLRRQAQLLALRPDLRIVGIRGNVDTRVRKALAPDGPDALVVAAAGVLRLGLEAQIIEYLPVEVMVPAVGQGALAVEVRADDRATRLALRGLDHAPTHAAVTAERAVLVALGGGCQVPLGVHAWLVRGGTALRLLAVLARPDGRQLLRVEVEGPVTRPVTLGRTAARMLRERGAEAILRIVLQR